MSLNECLECGATHGRHYKDCKKGSHMTTKIDRTRIDTTCPKYPNVSHSHLWDAKRGGYVCYLTDDVLSPSDLITDPHDRHGVPQTAAQTTISIMKFPTEGLPLQATIVGSKQVEAMDGQLRDALIVMFRGETPGGFSRMPSRTAYFALTPNGREWEYLSEAPFQSLNSALKNR